MDLITKLLASEGHDSIWVVCHRFLKISHFKVTTEKVIAEGLARLFRDNLWKLHGLLESVILVRGPQFVADLIEELNKMLGIEINLSTVIHPQTDRQIERTNQKLKQYLKMYINYKQSN